MINIEGGAKAQSKSKRKVTPFELVVKNNLGYWLRRFPWDKMPDVAELSVEKENIIKAIEAGLRFKSTYNLATHFLFIATDMMLHVGSNHAWNNLIQLAVDKRLPESDFVRGRLNLCKAKSMMQDEQYVPLKVMLEKMTDLAESKQDIDLLWEIKFMQGLVECHFQNYDKATECVNDVSQLLNNFTLLNPDLCKGKIATLGGELGIAVQDWEKAAYFLHTSIHHLEKSGSEYAQAIALELFGRYYEHQNDLDHALEMWEKAVELIPNGFSFENRSDLQINIARLYLAKGDSQRAKKILEELDYGMMRILGCLPLHLKAISLLSEIVREQGDLKQSELILENAENLIAEIAHQA